jgi:hypothetical protein
MKDKKVKQPKQGRVPLRGRRVNREGEEGQRWLMYFVYMYENKIMKSVEIVLRRV